jgi:NAD+--asparagine ADP-ribosyltransferase
MHSFKEYFQLFLERQYFADISAKLVGMTNQLKKQFDNIKELKIGDTFWINLNKNVKILIKIESVMPDDPTTFGEYDPKSRSIRLFIKAMYGDDSSKSLQYIKIKFPAKFEEILRHELSHAYEDLVTDVYQYTHYKPGSSRSYTKYINSTSEMNAYLNQWITSQLMYDRNIKNMFENRQLKPLVNAIMANISTHSEFSYLYEKNKNWFYKTIYTIIEKLIAVNKKDNE